MLHENESAQTVKAANAGSQTFAWRRAAANPHAFVRRIAQPTKMLDLLDVVAGGYGTVYRRERGIDPTTGLEVASFYPERHPNDGQYHAVVWHKFIDGVFVPNGGAGPVAIDSVGGTFDGFPPTTGTVYCPIWPAQPMASAIRQCRLGLGRTSWAGAKSTCPTIAVCSASTPMRALRLALRQCARRIRASCRDGSAPLQACLIRPF